MGHVAVDVVLRGARGEVGAALLAVDRAPGEERALRVAHDARAFAGLRQHGVTVLQKLSRKGRVGVDEHGQDIALRVPEGVALVALAGQTLRRDVARAVAPRRLQQVEEVEAQTLQQRVVAADLKPGVLPESVEESALLLGQRVEVRRAFAEGLRVPPQGLRVGVAPGGIADALFKAELLARRKRLFKDRAHAVGRRRGRADRQPPVLHGAADGEAAVFGLLSHGEQPALGLGSEGAQAAVLAGGVSRIVRVALGDHGGADAALDAQRADPVQAAHAQTRRGQLLMRQAHEPRRLHREGCAALRLPDETAREQTRAQIELALVLEQIALARVEALAVREQHKALRVHHVADRLMVFRVAVGRLAVADGLGIEHAVEEAALDRLGARCAALLQIAAQADQTVAEREDRLIFPQVRAVKALLGDRPGLVSKFGVHMRCRSFQRFFPNVCTSIIPWSAQAPQGGSR